MSSIILTGFEPFGGYTHNPTEDAVKHFHGRRIGQHDVVGLVMECTYFEAFEKLRALIDEVRPDGIVSLGLASRVKGIRIEGAARNAINSEYADANGLRPNGKKIIDGGTEFFSANANISQVANALYEHGIPTEISGDAEAFVCNALYYQTLQYIEEQRLNTYNLFCHVPWTDNYRESENVPPEKITISTKQLHDAIDLIIRNVCGD